jgi:hypothetical protein
VFIHIELVCIQNETYGGVSVRFDQVPRRRTNLKMMKKIRFSDLSLVSYLVTYIDIFVLIIVVMKSKQDFPLLSRSWFAQICWIFSSMNVSSIMSLFSDCHCISFVNSFCSFLLTNLLSSNLLRVHKLGVVLLLRGVLITLTEIAVHKVCCIKGILFLSALSRV